MEELRSPLDSRSRSSLTADDAAAAAWVAGDALVCNGEGTDAAAVDGDDAVDFESAPRAAAVGQFHNLN
jgi:hypothetical protein